MTNKEALSEFNMECDSCIECRRIINCSVCEIKNAKKALEIADKLWGDNFEEWYERYHENMN